MLADIDKARQRFETRVMEPNPQVPRRSRRNLGWVEAFQRGAERRVGSLSFAVDDEVALPVQTIEFATEPGYRRQGIALLLAYDLREHYGVAMLRSSPMKPTEDGAILLRSLRRRGIMSE